MIRERGEDLPRESCFGFVVMVVISCWRFLEVRGKVSGEKPNLRVFFIFVTLATPQILEAPPG